MPATRRIISGGGYGSPVRRGAGPRGDRLGERQHVADARLAAHEAKLLEQRGRRLLPGQHEELGSLRPQRACPPLVETLAPEVHPRPRRYHEPHHATHGLAVQAGGRRSGICMRAIALTRSQNIVPAAAITPSASRTPSRLSAWIKSSDQITIPNASRVWKPSTAQ